MELFKGKTLGPLFILKYIEELKERNEFEKFQDNVHSLLPTVFRTISKKYSNLMISRRLLLFTKRTAQKEKFF